MPVRCPEGPENRQFGSLGVFSGSVCYWAFSDNAEDFKRGATGSVRRRRRPVGTPLKIPLC
jgi:hypothetical protein